MDVNSPLSYNGKVLLSKVNISYAEKSTTYISVKCNGFLNSIFKLHLVTFWLVDFYSIMLNTFVLIKLIAEL